MSPTRNNPKTEVLLNWLTETLECSQFKIARLIGVDPHTLSNNKEKRISELTPVTRELLLSFFEVTKHLSDLRTDAFLAVIQRHVFQDLDGKKDSVISALRQQKYPIDTLIEIANLSRQEYHQAFLATAPEVSDEFSISA